MAVRLSALRAGRSFTHQKQCFSSSGTHFFYRLINTQGLMQPEGLGKSLKIIHLIRSRTRHVPSSSVVL
jgi:hypothetical protein